MGLWYILEYQYPTEMAVADLSCLSFRFLLLQIRDGTHQHLVASNIFADLAQVFCKNVHLSRLSSQGLMGNLQSAMSNLKYLDGKPDNLGKCKIFRKKGHLSRNSHQSRHVALANYVFFWSMSKQKSNSYLHTVPRTDKFAIVQCVLCETTKCKQQGHQSRQGVVIA